MTRCESCGHDAVRPDGGCSNCESIDSADQRRDNNAWRDYVARQRGMFSEIATVAPQVLNEVELEIIGSDLLRRPEEEAAELLGMTVESLRETREEAHQKIRDGIGEERLAARWRR